MADTCAFIADLSASIRQERDSAVAWALTEAPARADALDATLRDLRDRLSVAKANEDAAERALTFQALNAGGAVVFTILGAATVGTTAGLVYTGSVVVTQTLIMAKALAGPTRPDAIDVVSMSGNNIGGAVGLLDDPIYGMSGRVGAMGAAAGSVLGLGLAAYSLYELHDKFTTEAKFEAQRREIEARVADAAAAQADLRDPAKAEDLRREAMDAMLADLAQANSTEGCDPIILP